MTNRNGDALIKRISDPSRSPEQRGEDAYQLLQELFAGFPASNLTALLVSDNSSVVEAGIWVLSELGNHAAPLLGAIEPLLEHPSRKVRYWAIDVVHSSAGSGDGKVISKALDHLEDADSGVRQAALYFLAHASSEQLSAAIDKVGDTGLGKLLIWLSKVPASDNPGQEIAGRFPSDDRLVRMVAVAAAARSRDHARPTLERAAEMDDDDLSVFASRELAR